MIDGAKRQAHAVIHSVSLEEEGHPQDGIHGLDRLYRHLPTGLAAALVDLQRAEQSGNLAEHWLLHFTI